MTEEQWRPPPGYAGWYEVSDLGRIMSLPRPGTPGGLVAVYLNSKGYPAVTLSKYGRTRTFPVARLVLGAFRESAPRQAGPVRARRDHRCPAGQSGVAVAPGY